MPIKVTELTFLNHFAPRFGIPVPRHIEGDAKRPAIKKALGEWGGEALVKPDILAGKRGKAGAIVPVTNVQEAMHEVKRLSGTR